MSSQHGGPRRVRRPETKAELLERLQQEDSPFTTLGSIMLFAAGVGWWRDQRVPFERSGETIRMEALTRLQGSEAFINMLALSQTDDISILSDERFDERIRVFEEYANGGLDILGALIDDTPKRIVDIVRDLVSEAAGSTVEKPDQLDISNVDLGFVKDE